MTLRYELQVIARHVKEGDVALDVGCGAGDLLHYLKAERRADARGMDIDPVCVQRCMRRGLNAVQGDAERDLAHYPSRFFDVVIAGQMIQTTHNPKKVLEQMIRIGKRQVISVPNFGYWRNRLGLLLGGRMPVTKRLSYQWYETPNIHFCTAKDFRILAEEEGCRIVRVHYLLDDKLLCRPLRPFSNLFATQAVFVLEGRE
jgi:methionine biosynthesis protein MetW